jgi:hypothetical protein
MENKMKIAIIGSGDGGRTILPEFKSEIPIINVQDNISEMEILEIAKNTKDTNAVILIGNDFYDIKPNIITIDGIDYEEILPNKKKYKSKYSNIINGINISNEIFSQYSEKYYDLVDSIGTTKTERKLPDNIDIIKEFELIKKKKSKLSSFDRKEVEKLFFKKYKLIYK